MTDVSINGVPHTPAAGNSVDDISAERLRTIVQHSDPSFLIETGTPSSFFDSVLAPKSISKPRDGSAPYGQA